MSNGKYHSYFSLEKSRAVRCNEMPVRFRVCRRRRFVRQSRECRRKRTSSELENWAPDPIWLDPIRSGDKKLLDLLRSMLDLNRPGQIWLDPIRSGDKKLLDLVKSEVNKLSDLTTSNLDLG